MVIRSAALVLAVASLARAQAPEDPKVRAARGHFQAGQVYFQQGDFRRALVEFQKAARDVDLPALDYDIARSWDRLGDAARAVERYERYLARAGDAEDRAQVAARVRELRPLVGTITIASKVAGAAVTLDGEAIEATRLGQPLRVTSGAHTLAASKDGHLTRTVEVRVAGEQSVTVEVDPTPIAPQKITEKVVVIEKQKAPRWWIGVVVGAVAVAAGAAITTGVLLGGPVEEQLVKGNVSPGIQRITP